MAQVLLASNWHNNDGYRDRVCCTSWLAPHGVMQSEWPALVSSARVLMETSGRESESESCFVTPWIYSPWNSVGQNAEVGNLSLLQGIFPTQGSNPGLLHCRWILYQLSHKGSPRILVWVAYPFSSGSSRSRNQTGVSCIAGGFFTN